jgi:hypothetical protein
LNISRAILRAILNISRASLRGPCLGNPDIPVIRVSLKKMMDVIAPYAIRAAVILSWNRFYGTT